MQAQGLVHPPRIAGFDYLGGFCYSLTCCTRLRQPLFRLAAVVKIARDALERAAEDHRFALLIYCFMPDHVHLLVQGEDDNSDFRMFVTSFKQRSAFAYAKDHGGRLWQKGYWERVLRGDQSSVEVARYIAANPVRAGLVVNPLQYTFTGSGVFDLATLLVDTGLDAGRRHG